MTFYLSLAFGAAFAWFTSFVPQDIPFYEHVLYALLAVGLYGSVYGIDLGDFKQHRNIVLKAVTFGVALKGIVIGAGLWLLLGTPLAFLLGMVVAQIDPLAVSYLVDKKGSQFSSSGRTVLRAWSSFDDPMTVLLALYVFLPLAMGTAFDFGVYVTQFGYNLVFALLFFGISRFVPARFLVVPAFLVAVPFQLMLGIALCGLFLRPSLDSVLPRLTNIAFVLAAGILGMLVSFDLELIGVGLLLGVAAFLSQVLAAVLVAKGLSSDDKLFLAVAQYNGITSVILALVIGAVFGEVVTIIAVAVVTINSIYYVTNHMVERRTSLT
jgi:hypothetical protein